MSEDGGKVIVDKTSKREEIFDELSEPFQKLVFDD